MSDDPKAILGWREWLRLPQIGIERIKCKVDTGARTSALHAFKIEPIGSSHERIRFWVHPLQRRTDIETVCEASVKDRRMVSDSGGHRERRYVIETIAEIGQQRLSIELTLTDRDTMVFRMLLGRTALKEQFVVDPARSYAMGKLARKRRR